MSAPFHAPDPTDKAIAFWRLKAISKHGEVAGVMGRLAEVERDLAAVAKERDALQTRLTTLLEAALTDESEQLVIATALSGEVARWRKLAHERLGTEDPDVAAGKLAALQVVEDGRATRLAAADEAHREVARLTEELTKESRALAAALTQRDDIQERYREAERLLLDARKEIARMDRAKGPPAPPAPPAPPPPVAPAPPAPPAPPARPPRWIAAGDARPRHGGMSPPPAPPPPVVKQTKPQTGGRKGTPAPALFGRKDPDAPPAQPKARLAASTPACETCQHGEKMEAAHNGFACRRKANECVPDVYNHLYERDPAKVATNPPGKRRN